VKRRWFGSILRRRKTTPKQLRTGHGYLNYARGVISHGSHCDLLDHLAASSDDLHGEPGLELRTVGAALAHGWQPLFRSGAPPKRLTMGADKKPDLFI
jgi:hypothetical protein